MTTTERFLSVLASIISIGQLAIAVPSLIGLFNPPSIVVHVAALAVPARVAIFVILEVSCAHVFGLLFALASNAEHEAVSLLAFISISVVNAWLSLFNIQYFLFRTPSTQWRHLLAVFPIAALAAALACLFAAIHVDTVKGKGADLVGAAAGIQAIAYSLLCIALWFQ